MVVMVVVLMCCRLSASGCPPSGAGHNYRLQLSDCVGMRTESFANQAAAYCLPEKPQALIVSSSPHRYTHFIYL